MRRVDPRIIAEAGLDGEWRWLDVGEKIHLGDRWDRGPTSGREHNLDPVELADFRHTPDGPNDVIRQSGPIARGVRSDEEVENG